MSNPRDIAEPSMEEILSSIRRIIAAEEPKPAAAAGKGAAALAVQPTPRAAVPAEAPRAPDDPAVEDEDAAELGDGDDVLELTAAVDEAPAGSVPIDLPAPAEQAEPAAASPPSVPAPPSAATKPAGRIAMPTAASQKESPEMSTNGKTEALVSDTASAAATGAFSRLSQNLRGPADGAGPLTPDQRPIEQVVVDALRPMLKSWLDEHLPAIVERLVQQEIGKMARRAELA